MIWTDSDTDGETYLRLVRSEAPHRSAMETRHGQQAAKERLLAIWDTVQSKQAVGRALARLTLAAHLAPEKRIKPLQWFPKTKTGSEG